MARQKGHPHRALLALAALGALLSACGPAPTVTTSAHAALLTLRQMNVADFYVLTSPHSVPLSAAYLGPIPAHSLSNTALSSGAGERLYREFGDIALTNGPVDVVSNAFVLATDTNAAALVTAACTSASKEPQSTQLSIGEIGQGGCGWSRVATIDSYPLQQYTVIWQVDNACEEVVIRGSQNGTALDQAISLATTQTKNQKG